MSPVVIILIIIGLALIIVSYAFAEKLDGKKDESIIEIPEELTQEQKDKIQKLIDDYMDERVDSKLGEIEDKFSQIVNEKTLALGDYAVTVNEEIEKNHNEVMFLYNMLSDKQKEIMTTATMVDDYRKEVETFVENNHITVKKNDDSDLEEAIKEIDENISEENEKSDAESSNEIILELHKSGLSILEIAKQLGLGVGEVKLVVDLYQGANE